MAHASAHKARIKRYFLFASSASIQQGRKEEKMPFQGYVRFPTIHEDSIVFVAEDDLWLIESTGGRAERLTAGGAEGETPSFAPNGQHPAVGGRARGAEGVYLIAWAGDWTTRPPFRATL